LLPLGLRRPPRLPALLLVRLWLSLSQVSRVQGEASGVWGKLAAAEQGSTMNRLYK
jgi:hypothetical protein